MDDRGKNWKDIIVENNEYKKKVHNLRQEVYTKENKDLINTYILSDGSALKWGEHHLDLW